MTGEVLRIAHRINSVSEAKQVLQDPATNGIEVDAQSVLGSKLVVARHTQLFTFGFLNNSPFVYDIASILPPDKILMLDTKYWRQAAIQQPFFSLLDQVSSDGLEDIRVSGIGHSFALETSRRFPHVGVFATINSKRDLQVWEKNGRWGDGVSVHAKVLEVVEPNAKNIPVFVHHAGVERESAVVRHPGVSGIIFESRKQQIVSLAVAA